MITNTEAVEAYFGYWPEFADAHITRLGFDEVGQLSLSLNYIDANQSLAADITLQFDGVSDIELTDLLTHNVVDAISPGLTPPFRLEIEACAGLTGSFAYTSARVMAFVIRPA